MKNLLRLFGIYLLVDSLISIYYASIGNITLTLHNWDFNKLLMIGQLFRIIRLIIGVYIFKGKSNNLKIIGVYLIIDAIISIIVANEFNSWDDYLRIPRAYVGWRLYNG